MTDPFQLEQIQKWMQAVITHPRGITAGIGSDAAREQINVAKADVETVITRSQTRTSVERLAVYGNAYFARLMECTRDFFPVTCKTVGEKLFDQFALEYLVWYPSRSYTLSRLADRFIEYLEETRPAPSRDASFDDGTPPADFAGFIIDLARLEFEIAQVFDGPGIEHETPLRVEALQTISPDQWSTVRLVTAPCLKLLLFHYPISEYFTAARKSAKLLPIPPGEPTYLALSRRDYVVRRYSLSQPQFSMLTELQRGSTIGEAIETVVKWLDDDDQLAESLRNWFTTWTRDGFFLRVDA